jgi:hypothetical protein
MQHPDEGTVHAWLDDALSAEDAQALETHVASCAACAAVVAEARGLIASASRIVRQLDGVPAKVVPEAAKAQATTADTVVPITTAPSRRTAVPSWTRYSGIAAALVFVGSTATWMALRDKGPSGIIVPSVAMQLDAAKSAPVATGSLATAPAKAEQATAVVAATSQPPAAPVARSLTSGPTNDNVARAATSLADRQGEASNVPAVSAPAVAAQAAPAPAFAAPAMAARMSSDARNESPVTLAGCYRLTPVAATGNSVAGMLRLTDSLAPSEAATRTTAAPTDRLTAVYVGYATGLGAATALAERVQASANVNAPSSDAARAGSARSAMAAAATPPSRAPTLVLNTNAMIRWSPAGDGLVRLLLADQSTLLIRLSADAQARADDVRPERDPVPAAAAQKFTASRMNCPQ